MIHYVRIASLVTVMMVGAAFAETPFVVRVDESPTDSLVTIDVGAAPFMLEQIGPRQIDLVTPDKARVFDLSAVLATGASRRIAATRVVSDDQLNRLRLTLGCECAYGFAISNGVLSLTFRAPEPEAEVRGAPNARGVSRFAPGQSPRPFPRPDMSGNVADVNPPNSPILVSAADEDVLLARKHLLEQLSRAADQGLLEYVSEQTDASVPSPLGGDPMELTRVPSEQDSGPVALVEAVTAKQEAIPKGPLRPPGPRETSLRARTAIDKSFRADRGETLSPVASCVAAAELDLSKWQDTGEFNEQVALYRQKLLDEFDQPKPDVVQSLAQVYALNGFGVEAERLLLTFGAEVHNRRLLIEVARTIDDRTLDAGGPLAKTAPCNGTALLWRRAADLPRNAAKPSPEIWSEMADAFTDLPRKVRERIAAPVLSSLVDGGEIEQAERLNLILSRAPVRNAMPLDLARARLLAAGGEAVAAEGLYQRLAQRDAPEARESLIRLLDSRLSRGASVSPALADALSDLAFATRGQPLELIAKAAEIRAHAAIDGPAAALGAVREAIERTPNNVTVLKDAGHAALERLSPGEGQEATMSYVQAVTAYEPLVSTGRDGDAARRRVAEELTSLGLSNAALTYLAPARMRPDEGVRLIVAEALVSLGHVDEGLAELGEADNAKARELRALALARQGDFAAAAGADPADQTRALSAGDWEAAAVGEGARAALAKYMAKPPVESQAEEPPVSLSGARAAQDAARATRALIDEALSDG